MKRHIFIILLIISCAANAHHSSSPHFDPNQPVTITGEITRFRFVNPHAYLYLNVTGEDGSVMEWNCEMSAASMLKRNGWTAEVFKPGTKVTLNGEMARRDPHGCTFRNGTLEDGRTITRNGPISDAPVQMVAEASIGQVDTTSIVGRWMTQPRNRGGSTLGTGAGTGAAMGMGGLPGMDRYLPYLTEAGITASEKYDDRFDDPAFSCSASSIIRGWSEPNGVSDIRRDGNRIIIRHEYMDVTRVIHLNGGPAPDNFKPSMTGYSVGEFEGDVLMIVTTQFEPGVLVPHPGVVNSDQMRIVERLSLTNGGQDLVREYSVTDPPYLKEPITGTNTWNRSTLPLNDYNCVELSGVSKVRPE